MNYVPVLLIFRKMRFNLIGNNPKSIIFPTQAVRASVDGVDTVIWGVRPS